MKPSASATQVFTISALTGFAVLGWLPGVLLSLDGSARMLGLCLLGAWVVAVLTLTFSKPTRLH